MIAAACDDGTVLLLSVPDLRLLGSLKGHEDAAQAVVWDSESNYLITAGSDCTYRVWTAMG